MGFLEWATSPWGQSVPIHIAWLLIWVALIAGLLFLIAHADLRDVFRQGKRVRRQCFSANRGADTQACPAALAGRTAVSLDHGSLYVHAAFYRFPAEGGCPI